MSAGLFALTGVFGILVRRPWMLRLIRTGAVAKGDPLQAARLAGIMAAKQTSALIPLCHPLPITAVTVDLVPEGEDAVAIAATCRGGSSSP